MEGAGEGGRGREDTQGNAVPFFSLPPSPPPSPLSILDKNINLVLDLFQVAECSKSWLTLGH